MISALERYQEQKGLKIDGVAKPGGPTERSINNDLLEKPRGAGLLYDPPPALAGTVGNGFDNRREDVIGVQRRLGALGYVPEDPFDKPHGFIDENTTNGIKEFQRAKGLADDGWMAQRGETERALEAAVSDLARAKGGEWFASANRIRRAKQAFASKLGEPRDDESSWADDGNTEVGIEPARISPQFLPQPQPAPVRPTPAPQTWPPFYFPNFIGVDPRLVQPPRPDPRRLGPLPGDLKWENAPQVPSDPRSGPGILRPLPRNAAPPSRTPSEPVSVDDVELALRQKPLPNPNELETYTPEPGSLLGISIIGLKRPGRLGDERTIETNTVVAKTIEKACKEVMKDVEVVHYGGPGSIHEGEKAISSPTEGRSFPDFETQVHYKGFTIHIFGDSYTPKVDRLPNAREQRQFGRLDRIATELDLDRIYVRLPKPWLIDEEIDPDKLAKFTKELCKEVKKAVDEGRIGRGKDALSIEQFFEELTKARKPAPKKPEEAAPDRGPRKR